MRRSIALVAVALVAALGLAPTSSSAAPAASPTTGCRAVGGGEVAGGGPSRATVVVDTGSGPVWSACISFSGTISGTKALELAGATIEDLDPVYDSYAGEGRAVCRLRGVGTDPPDCLGKSVEYWSFWVNGGYARGGAGSTVVRDGDVHGWRYGTGSAPRAATAGTEAHRTATAPTTTTAPPRVTTTTQPRPSTTPTPGGGLAVRPGATTVPDAPSDAGAPDASGDGATTTTTVAEGDEVAEATAGDEVAVEAAADDSASSEDADAGDDDGGEGDESALAAPVDPGAGGGSADGGGSPVGAVVGFVVVLGAIGAGSVLVRRRRVGAVAAPS